MYKKTLLVSFLTACCASYAQIYQWTDAQGLIHFSDSPHAGAKTVKNLEIQSYSSPEPQGTSQADDSQTDSDQAKEAYYQEISITLPHNEETIRNNQGAIDVVFTLSPTLLPGNQVQLLIDGAPVGKPQKELSFHVNGIDRGAHILQVQVLDKQGKPMILSDRTTIFMQRPRVGMVKKKLGV